MQNILLDRSDFNAIRRNFLLLSTFILVRAVYGIEISDFILKNTHLYSSHWSMVLGLALAQLYFAWRFITSRNDMDFKSFENRVFQDEALKFIAHRHADMFEDFEMMQLPLKAPEFQWVNSKLYRISYSYEGAGYSSLDPEIFELEGKNLRKVQNIVGRKLSFTHATTSHYDFPILYAAIAFCLMIYTYFKGPIFHLIEKSC